MKQPLQRNLTGDGWNLNSRREEQNNEIFKDRTWISLIWSISVFFFNIYTLFTIIYWISIAEMPSGFSIFVDLAFETLLLVDILLRVLIRCFSKEFYDGLNLIHTQKDDGWKRFVFTFVGSLPIMIIYSANDNSSKNIQEVFARLLAFKFLRCFETLRALARTEEILFYKRFRTLVFVKYFKNVMIVLFITHLTTCAWLLVEKTNGNAKSLNGFSPLNPYKDSKNS